MVTLALPAQLEAMRQRLIEGRSLTLHDADELLAWPDVLEVGALADFLRRRKWGDAAHYENGVRHAFSSDSIFDEVAAVRAADAHGWIEGLATAQVRALEGDLDDTLTRLHAAGLDGILGDDEEFFTQKGRVLLSSDDISMDVHAAAHRAGLTSVASVRYGAEVDINELLARLSALRDQQRATGGFSVAVPVPESVESGPYLRQNASGYEDLRVTAVVRLFLDNIPHVRVPWFALGLKMGQVALSFGADDIGWAPLDPLVRQHAHPATFLAMEEDSLRRCIEAAGFRPVRVDGAWKPVADAGYSANSREPGSVKL